MSRTAKHALREGEAWRSRAKAGHGCVLAFMLFAMWGCTNANRQLGDLSVPVDARVHNHTQAALAAKVIAPQAQGAKAAAVAPDAQPERKPDVRDDGVFVGIAISGGGS